MNGRRLAPELIFLKLTFAKNLPHCHHYGTEAEHWERKPVKEEEQGNQNILAVSQKGWQRVILC